MDSPDDPDDPLRVLLSTPDYESPGGIQTLTRNLERGLKNLGSEVRVVHVDPKRGYSLSSYLPRPQWIESVDDLRFIKWPYRNEVYTRVSTMIEKFDPDIVHALHIEHYPALVAARERNISSFVSCHALELRNWKIAAKAISEASRIHVVSEFTQELVHDIIKNSDCLSSTSLDRTYVVNPSVDIDWYVEKRTGKHEPSVPASGSVVTLSRLKEDYKNIETIVEAWKHLPEEVTASRDLIIAGDGPKQDSLKRLADGIDDVYFPGYVSEETKRDLLSDASVFAFVPRGDGYQAEGFGIVYIESQAAGTPVVGSANGGAPEAIGDGGLVVNEESDPRSVADAIESLIVKQSCRQECLTAIDERIGQFQIDSIALNHIRIYRDVSESGSNV